ncbi:MAG: hypothetical protein K1X78_22090 [Verrucomicrobiaceae bacterium]|nr:hypothetical protein [Verrucomicrobiaceae bacterium]
MHRCLAAFAIALAASSCSTVVREPRWTAKVLKHTPGGKQTVKVNLPPPKMQKWNPLWWAGNVDCPEPPPDYKPADPRRARKYQWRNPFHNFAFYVIGIADKKTTRTGLYPDDVFRPGGGMNFAVSRWHCLFFPFASYHDRHISTYIGWRQRGNFGAKLNIRWQGRPPENAKHKAIASSSTSIGEQTESPGPHKHAAD